MSLYVYNKKHNTMHSTELLNEIMQELNKDRRISFILTKKEIYSEIIAKLRVYRKELFLISKLLPLSIYNLCLNLDSSYSDTGFTELYNIMLKNNDNELFELSIADEELDTE